MISAAGLLLTAGQQRALDEASICAGTPSEVLMESAGRNAAEWILAHAHPSSAVLLAGPGGNGGDALVVARHLLQAGSSVQCFASCSDDVFTPVTRFMADQFRQVGGSIHVVGSNLAMLEHAAADADCIIDGLLGSGLSRALSGHYAAMVDVLNQQDTPIISLDMPSGLPADSGDILGPSIQAAMTLAMAFYKPSHWLYPAAESCGAVHLVDVAYPDVLTNALHPLASVPDLSDVRGLLPARPPAGHKGTFGHVLIIAGSEGMSGAVILCARAALRVGTGLVTLAVPSSILMAVQCAVPEALTISLPDATHYGSDEHSEQLDAALRQAKVLAIGPGLSRTAPALAWVRDVVLRYSGSVVMDASAIHAFVDHLDFLAPLAGRCILTPHPGEFAALLDITAGAADAGRLGHVAGFVERWPLALVLKGRPTVTGLSDQSVHLNPTGNMGLATGGSGDVLTGLLAGLVAGGSSIDAAAVAGPFIHGLAADRWREAYSERSLMPSDIIEALPRILKELES